MKKIAVYDTHFYTGHSLQNLPLVIESESRIKDHTSFFKFMNKNLSVKASMMSFSKDFGHEEDFSKLQSRNALKASSISIRTKSNIYE